MDLRVVGIVKKFGEAAALSDANLEIRAGELMALLGPSGSGKTTLLRVIAGLEFPDEGQVFFGKEDATGLAVQSRGVGFVFQHYALFRHLTVFENVAYGLRARKGARRPTEPEIARRVRELLELVQLPGLERRFPAQLSGGQRQRVALARALAVEPSVLLLDEPFGALDAKVRRDLRRWLRDIHERTGRTTVFVTHDQDEALELADRVAILNGGQVEQVGTPDELHDAPASAFVMSFVGETAALPVQVSDGRPWLGEHQLDVTLDGVPDGPAELFVRPWDFALALDGVSGVPAVLGAARRSGKSRRVMASLKGVEKAVEVELDAEHGTGPGEQVRIVVTRGRAFTEGRHRASR